MSPHSLGKPIEWKLCRKTDIVCRVSSPHSLGKPIEWKLAAACRGLASAAPCPHSLGKPIEWKPLPSWNERKPNKCSSPHSLGKPIEWKPGHSLPDLHLPSPLVPTRWGNQLNGNLPTVLDGIVKSSYCPHSLGKPIEWKLAFVECDRSFSKSDRTASIMIWRDRLTLIALAQAILRSI